MWLPSDDLRWLEPDALSLLESLLPIKMWQWLGTSVTEAEPKEWMPFKLNANALPATELHRWQLRAKFPANMRRPDCLGVRSLQDLQHVATEMQLTVMRPIQQARLRWALRSYQQQLAAERPVPGAAPVADAEERHNAREQARIEVAAAYNMHLDNHDVQSFIQDLGNISGNSTWDATRSSPPLAPEAPGWRRRMLRIIRQAYCMAHPDKHHQASTTQYAYACEVFLKLKEWERRITLQYPSR